METIKINEQTYYVDLKKKTMYEDKEGTKNVNFLFLTNTEKEGIEYPKKKKDETV